MITLLYLGAILFSSTQSALNKIYAKNGGDVYVFNLLKVLFAFFAFLLMAIAEGQRLHMPTVGLGVIFAAAICAANHFGFKALWAGPVSLSGFIVSFYTVIPIFYGIFFCSEKLSVFGIIGLCLLVPTFILLKAKDKKGIKPAKNWKYYIMLTILSNGIFAVVQKIHQTLYPKMYVSQFMCAAMFFSVIIVAVMLIVKYKGECIRVCIAQKGKVYAAVSGLANGGANFMTLLLAGYEDASVMFPIVSAGVILANLLCGMIVFYEKPSKYQLLAFLPGVAAVILLKL